MKPQEFFEVGHLLSEVHSTAPEGCGRSAISRYYYAAFLQARDALRDKTTINFKKKHNLHENVKRAFAWSDVQNVKKVGRLLEDLKKLREMADYDVSTTFDNVTVSEAMQISNEIRLELDSTGFDYAACKDPGP